MRGQMMDTPLLISSLLERLTDTPDRLDYDRMARVVTGIAAVVRQLARGE